MNTDSRVLVTGATGMVGAALVRRLRAAGIANVLAPPRRELDLLVAEQVRSYLTRHRPEYVFMIAARVGGIAANMADPVGFLAENAQSELNLFAACHQSGVRKALFLGSSCIYPRSCPQPMREEHLMTGPLEPTNEGYALAKLLGIRLAAAYRSQHGLNTICPMPCNVYGTGDHFDLERAHVLSSLVRRFVDAVESGADGVTLWGTGQPRREFIHVDDLVDALLFLMDHYDDAAIINVGSGTDVTIRELAEMIGRATGFRGSLRWDHTKPDGMPRKCMDVSKLAALGFHPRISLEEGIQRTVSEYRSLKREGRLL